MNEHLATMYRDSQRELHAENTTLRAALHLWLAAHQARLDCNSFKISLSERDAAVDRAFVATVDALSQGEEPDAGR